MFTTRQFVALSMASALTAGGISGAMANTTQSSGISITNADGLYQYDGKTYLPDGRSLLDMVETTLVPDEGKGDQYLEIEVDTRTYPTDWQGGFPTICIPHKPTPGVPYTVRAIALGDLPDGVNRMSDPQATLERCGDYADAFELIGFNRPKIKIGVIMTRSGNRAEEAAQRTTVAQPRLKLRYFDVNHESVPLGDYHITKSQRFDTISTYTFDQGNDTIAFGPQLLVHPQDPSRRFNTEAQHRASFVFDHPEGWEIRFASRALSPTNSNQDLNVTCSHTGISQPGTQTTCTIPQYTATWDMAPLMDFQVVSKDAKDVLDAKPFKVQMRVEVTEPNQAPGATGEMTYIESVYAFSHDPSKIISDDSTEPPLPPGAIPYQDEPDGPYEIETTPPMWNGYDSGDPAPMPTDEPDQDPTLPVPTPTPIVTTEPTQLPSSPPAVVPTPSATPSASPSSTPSPSPSATPPPPAPITSQRPVDVESAEDRSTGWIDSVVASDETVNTVILGRDDVFADSLSSGGLQGVLDAPLFLNPVDHLSAKTKETLERVKPERVILMGGTVALNQQVADGLLAMGLEVERLDGTSRIETAIMAAKMHNPMAKMAVLARAYDAEGKSGTQAFADTLAGGAFAAHEGVPVLLTQSDTLTPSVAEYLKTSHIRAITVLGGEEALAPAVVHALEDLGIKVERVHGANRVDTSIKLAQAMGYANAGEATNVLMVNADAADAWTDAFPAALYAKKYDVPVILTSDTIVSNASRDWLNPGQIKPVPTNIICGYSVDLHNQVCTHAPAKAR